MKLKKIKICFIGLGSIGKRHIKNIVTILNERNIEYEIDAVRSKKSSLPDEVLNHISKEYYEVDKIPEDYDVIFITNPTDKHYDTMVSVMNKTKYMFVEKPIFHKVELDYSMLMDKNIYVACPLRHHPVFGKIKEIIQKEEVIAVRAITSSYLPYWRKGVDYRKTYSSNKKQGGGVSLDLIHEWDYLVDLFGFPQKITNIQKKVSNLEIDCEDISLYIAEYNDKVIELHLDYIGQKTERKLSIFTNKSRIDADFINNKIEVITNNVVIKTYLIDAEDIYINEMNYFINYCECNESDINSASQAVKVLQIAVEGV